MSHFDIKILSTEEILTGLDELIAGMKRDEVLNKKFTAILEDSKRRIISCEWVDYTKKKPEKDLKAVFKYPNSPCAGIDYCFVDSFYKTDALIKKNCEEDGYKDIIANIMERVNSGVWNNFRGKKPSSQIKVIYKAKILDNYWEYGVSLYHVGRKRIIYLTNPELCETIWWKPLEIEEVV